MKRKSLHAAARVPREPAVVSLALSGGEVEIVMTTYRALPHEISAKGMEFSRVSLRERWEAGQSDRLCAIQARANGQASLRDLGFALYRPTSPAALPAPLADGPFSKPANDPTRLISTV